MVVLRLVLLFGCVVSTVHGIRFMNANHPDSIPGDQVYITHNDHTHQSLRHRRDIPGMPSKFTFHYKHNGEYVHFNLTRGKAHLTTPLYLVGTDGLPYLTDPLPAEHLLSENSGVYRSDNNDGVFMVQRTPDDHNNYILGGTFYRGLKDYTIKPGRKEEEQHGIHYLQDHDRIRRDADGFSGISFRNDWRVDKLVDKTRETETETSAMTDAMADEQEQGPFPITIEIFYFVDDLDYNKFVAFAAPGAVVTDDVLLFYAFVEECMNVRYGTIFETDSSFRITIRATGILIATVPGGNPWISNNAINNVVDPDDGLADFRKYIDANVGSTIPISDHYMSFTGSVMADELGQTAGIAFLGTLCKRDSSISLVRNLFDGFTCEIASHELGHSLDARHDEDIEGCSSDTNNIMTTFLKNPESVEKAMNSWRFSNCSIEYMKFHLQIPFFGSCTYPENTRTSASVLQTNGHFAGQVYDADEQCRRLSNDTSQRFCRTAYGADGSGFTELCWKMYCGTNDSDCSANVAYEMTSCGNGKWCDKSLCMPNAAAPARLALCPQGDDPTANCLSRDCDTYSATKRLLTCCATCSATTVRSVNLVCKP